MKFEPRYRVYFDLPMNPSGEVWQKLDDLPWVAGVYERNIKSYEYTPMDLTQDVLQMQADLEEIFNEQHHV